MLTQDKEQQIEWPPHFWKGDDVQDPRRQADAIVREQCGKGVGCGGHPCAERLSELWLKFLRDLFVRECNWTLEFITHQPPRPSKTRTLSLPTAIHAGGWGCCSDCFFFADRLSPSELPSSPCSPDFADDFADDCKEQSNCVPLNAADLPDKGPPCRSNTDRQWHSLRCCVAKWKRHLSHDVGATLFGYLSAVWLVS